MGATKTGKPVRKPRAGQGTYAALRAIDGRHPYKEAVPGGFVDYQARRRHGGEVAYFNFDLAIEMGLIPKGHPRRLDRALRDAILDAFAIQIINEYDMINGTPVPAKDMKPHRYMATRYLQLQHPDKRGTTSGDGRSVWNGTVTHRGVTWDVSSCGTGATCLSPATAIQKKFFRTGDPEVAYGCGLADLKEGFAAAIFSEILHRKGVPTERTLAVINFGRGFAINVRASKNLIRPSHMFLYLRQGHYASLKQAVDYFIERQVANGEDGYTRAERSRYEVLAEQMAVTFAKSAAIFERHYLFVWMDWDGDNILANGGIIDYGSVRQFGLFHHEYRYDDVDRMSTSIVEQRAKARDMVRTFAQLRDYLLTGERKRLADYGKDRVLDLFDKTFAETRLKLLVEQLGFDRGQAEYLFRWHRQLVERYDAVHTHFERATSRRGIYKVPDGVTSDAIYSMRDLQRELPRRLLAKGERPTLAELMELMASSFASKRDKKLTPNKQRRMQSLLKHYEDLIDAVARREKRPVRRVLLEVAMRSSVLNRADRVTGNAIVLMAERLAQESPKLKDEIQSLIELVIGQQLSDPNASSETLRDLGNRRVETVAKACLKLLASCKDGI